MFSVSESAIPEEYKKHGEGERTLSLTGIAVASTGDFYVVDGYGLDYIHRFSAAGEYKSTFGGPDAPYNFSNCHKIMIDPRFTPERILCTDRANLRLSHLNLDGEFLGVFAEGLRLPSAMAIHEEVLAVAELEGRVTLLDKHGAVVSTLGENTVKEEISTNETPPSKWREGVFTAPHGIAFDGNGDLYVAEWSKWGRVLRFNQAGSD